MTTPNTGPIPATDAEIAFHFASNPLKAKCLDCDPDDSGEVPGECNGWGCGFVSTLLARIEQEREMRREAETLIWAAEIAASSSGRNTFAHECKSFLARAAKMEADYAK